MGNKKEDIRSTGRKINRRDFLKNTILLGAGSIIVKPTLTKAFTIKKHLKKKRKPVLDSDWWSITGNPDLVSYLKSDNQQPVDFGVWQAKDNTWQLWSCIRSTKEPGKTRLFYGWQAESLTDNHWTPKGIKMRADPLVGETSGGLQAPYTFKEGDKWHMFYGDWNAICRAESYDGKIFKRVIQSNQERVTGMFTEGAGTNTRDPMILKYRDTYFCYYTAGTGFIDEEAYKDEGAVYCRTSKDLKHWSSSKVVSKGGRAGKGWGDHECPHVVKVDDYFYLFRTQQYGMNNVSSVYCSTDPLNFGVGYDAEFFITKFPVAAPELVHHGEQWYIFALNHGLDGIRAARLKWQPV